MKTPVTLRASSAFPYGHREHRCYAACRVWRAEPGGRVHNCRHHLGERRYDGNQTSVSLASAIYVYNNTNIVVQNNDITRFCDQMEAVRGSTCQESISIVKTNGFSVSNNRVHDAKQGPGSNPGGGEGIDAKEGSKNGIIAYNNVYNLVQLGIYVDAWDQLTENIQIYGNRVYNTAAGIVVGAENSGTVRNIKIRDNIIYNTGYHGIELSNAGTNGRREDIHIYNNTVVRNGFTAYKPPWCSLYGCADWGYGIRINTNNIGDISIHDNIIVNNHSSQIEWNGNPAGALNVNTNILYPRTTFDWPNEYYGTNAIEADPQFVNAASNDFYLRAGRPAIGVGVGGDPLDKDADGRQRPASLIDLDALMYIGTPSPTATPTSPPTATPTPPPSSGAIVYDDAVASGWTA